MTDNPRTIQPVVTEAIPVSERDHLFLKVITSQALTGARLRARLLLESGRTILTDIDVRPSATLTQTQKTQRLPFGYLLSLTVVASLGSPARGQMFVQAGIMTGGTTDDDITDVLIQDYPEFETGLRWPGSPLKSQIEPPGNFREQTISPPAAGADFTFTVPDNQMIRPVGVSFLLTCDATVASRYVAIEIQESSSQIIARGQASSSTIASEVEEFAFATGTFSNALSGSLRQAIRMPDVMMPPGYELKSDVINLQAADTITLVQFAYEEWIFTS